MARFAVRLSIVCALLALPQAVRGQGAAQEVQRLKQEIEELRKENRSLKQENELLKRQTGARPATTTEPEGKRDELVLDLGNGVKMEFIRIKAGEFLMGSPDSDKEALDIERPQHRVKITRDFYLGKYPVTQEQFLAVMGNNPSEYSSQFIRAHEAKIVDTRRFPVERVSWDGAMAFCAELRQREKRQRLFTLPTEAEWEYAQRAGTTTRYFFGDDPADLGLYAWFNGNSGGRTQEVGVKKPNPWGLYDMAGNVWQWCADRAPSPYQAGDAVDPKGPETGDLRVLRGNQWGLVRRADSATMGSRSAARSASRPGFTQANIGFRVCLRLDPGDNPSELQLEVPRNR